VCLLRTRPDSPARAAGSRSRARSSPCAARPSARRS
jgi:hypothetical protein